MSIILQRLKAEFPFVLSRQVTEGDLFEYCDRHNVAVMFDSKVDDGLFVHEQTTGIDLIFLNPRLIGQSLLYVFAHEVGHHLLHVPTQGSTIEHFDKYRNNRNHAEAEQVAAYLLLPESEIARLLDAGNIRDERLASLIVTRLQMNG